jgi:hypothetical protein
MISNSKYGNYSNENSQKLLKKSNIYASISLFIIFTQETQQKLQKKLGIAKTIAKLKLKTCYWCHFMRFGVLQMELNRFFVPIFAIQTLLIF